MWNVAREGHIAVLRTGGYGVVDCLKTSVGRAGVRTQWSHSTVDWRGNVFCAANSGTYTRCNGRRFLKFVPESETSVPLRCGFTKP